MRHYWYWGVVRVPVSQCEALCAHRTAPGLFGCLSPKIQDSSLIRREQCIRRRRVPPSAPVNPRPSTYMTLYRHVQLDQRCYPCFRLCISSHLWSWTSTSCPPPPHLLITPAPQSILGFRDKLPWHAPVPCRFTVSICDYQDLGLQATNVYFRVPVRRESSSGDVGAT